MIRGRLYCEGQSPRQIQKSNLKDTALKKEKENEQNFKKLASMSSGREQDASFYKRSGRELQKTEKES